MARWRKGSREIWLRAFEVVVAERVGTRDEIGMAYTHEEFVETGQLRLVREEFGAEVGDELAKLLDDPDGDPNLARDRAAVRAMAAEWAQVSVREAPHSGDYLQVAAYHTPLHHGQEVVVGSYLIRPGRDKASPIWWGGSEPGEDPFELPEAHHHDVLALPDGREMLSPFLRGWIAEVEERLVAVAADEALIIEPDGQCSFHAKSMRRSHGIAHVVRLAGLFTDESPVVLIGYQTLAAQVPVAEILGRKGWLWLDTEQGRFIGLHCTEF